MGTLIFRPLPYATTPLFTFLGHNQKSFSLQFVANASASETTTMRERVQWKDPDPDAT